jgi:hypothetical protein
MAKSKGDASPAALYEETTPIPWRRLHRVARLIPIIQTGSKAIRQVRRYGAPRGERVSFLDIVLSFAWALENRKIKIASSEGSKIER